MKQLYLFTIALLNVLISVAQAGTLDSTFSGVGFFRANNKSFSRAAIQTDQKFVVAGSGFPFRPGDFEIYRFTPEGLPDATFGIAGTARTTVGGNSAVREVLIQQDGRILVLGESRVAWPAGTGVIATTPIVRLTTNGQIDESFGDHGCIQIVFGNASSVYAGQFSMALQQDGKILVCGPDYTISGNTFSLWRFNTDGSIDNSFGTNGRVIKAAGVHAFSTRVVVQSDGKIVFLGGTTEFSRFVARYLTSGIPDPAFNGTGVYFYSGQGRFVDALIQPDGKILAAIDLGNSFYMQRFNSNGTPDDNFGAGGLIQSKFSLPVYTNTIDLQDSGKIILGGMYAPDPGAFGYGMALARYLPSGILDNTFGVSGVVMKYLGYNTGGQVISVTTKRIYVLGSGSENVGVYMNYGVIAAFKVGEPGPPSPTVTTIVPGTANPWLAGMPDGTQSALGDYVPANSPSLVNIKLIAGSFIEATNVTGTAAHYAPALTGPEGCLTLDPCIITNISHDLGAEYGKSNITAPINSLVGVFLDDNVPTSPTPPDLDFSTTESRDYLELHPVLKQVFFIGNGKTSAGIQQRIVVPAGATRLFLGIMDGIEWTGNTGAFNVTLSIFNAVSSRKCGVDKVMICHKGKSLCIASSAVRSHLAHGDNVGSCNTLTPGKSNGHKGDASVLDEEQAGRFTISNAPNPFHRATRLQYEIPGDGHVQIKVYNVLGREVATLVNSRQLRGIYTVSFTGETIPAGMYFYHLSYTSDEHERFTNVGKMVLLK